MDFTVYSVLRNFMGREAVSSCVWRSQGSIDMFSLPVCGARDTGHVRVGRGERSCGRSSRASWSHERTPHMKGDGEEALLCR